jgi:beta propeller repeat protein
MISKALLKSGVLAALLTNFCVFSSGQDRPGIECGCTKFENYVEPGLKNVLVEQGENVPEGASAKKNPRYILTSTPASPPDVVTISIKNRSGRLIFTETNDATGWGFSPDEDRFVMHGMSNNQFWVRLVNLNPDPGMDGEMVTPDDCKNIIWLLNPSSANISFSPHGNYLLFASLDSQDKLFLVVFNAVSGEQVYAPGGAFIEGSPSGKSVAGWGFSPDVKDATFVHAYLTDENHFSLTAVNLTNNPPDKVVDFSNCTNQQEYWRFSPCGDKFLRVYRDQSGSLQGQLYNTNNSDYIGFNANNYWYFKSSGDGHYMANLDGTLYPLADNTSDHQCDDIEKPVWENGKLELDKAEGTSIKLKWSGAIDLPAGNIVIAYRIYWKMESATDFDMKQLDAINSYLIDGLQESTWYDFKIEAGDAAGNWSTQNNPTAKLQTEIDQSPTWTDPGLNASGVTETRATLKWNAATDDWGIIYYEIVKDEVPSDTVNGEVLVYKTDDLMAGSKPRFIINAIDASGQTVSSGPALEVPMAAAEPPEWPAGATLNASDKTETTLALNWPHATDNCLAVVGYRVFRNGNQIGSVRYPNNTFQVKDLEEGNVYAFAILAIDESEAESDSLRSGISSLPGYSVFPLVVTAGDQKRPDISDKYVVWWDDSKDEGDIYAYDLENDSIIQVTSEPHAQFDPVVSGDRIVWTDARKGNWDIYMWDSEHGEVQITKNIDSQDLPAIDGDFIVWRDNRNGDFDIYMYDIVSGIEYPVSTHSGIQNWPDISGNYIVYADNRFGNWDIFMYSILDRKETSICTNSADQTFPVISGTNLWNIGVAYMDDRNGDNIYIYYPYFIGDQPYEFLVPLDQSPFISGQFYPHFADDHLVYQDKLGGSGADWNIYAYKFRTESYGKIIKICVDPLASADQIRPRTSKGNIVWEDKRNGNSDIYIWRRPPGTDLRISLREITDPILVGDTLKYIATVINDGPGIATAISAECKLPLMAKYVNAYASEGSVNAVGKTITWNIDTLRNGTSAELVVKLATFDLAILDLKASVTGSGFDPDPSNNVILEFTKVKNFVPGLVGEGTCPSVEVQPDGRIHIIYFANDTVMYATRTRKGKWEYTPLEYCMGCSNNDMLIDKKGNIQVVLSDFIWEGNPYSRLYHGVLTKEGQWSKEIIALSNQGFGSMSLQSDSFGELHLVYQEAFSTAQKGNMMVMSTVGGEWTTPIQFAEGYDHVDMEVDEENKLHTSYYVINTGLVYRKNQLAGSGAWDDPEVVEPGWSGGQLEGMVTSVTTDQQQDPHISYVGSVNNDHIENIKYAWKKENRWNITMVDRGHFQSAGNKVLIDHDGNANFSYVYNPWWSGDVRYATNIAGPWVKQIVDEGKRALTVDMGLDLDKFTHITYSGINYSGDTIQLYYALLPQIEYFEALPDTLDFGAVDAGEVETINLLLENPSAKDIRIDSLILNNERVTLSKTSFILGRFATDTVRLTLKQTADPWTDTFLRIWYNVPSGLFMDIPVIAKNRQPELTIDQAEPIYFGAVASGSSVLKTVKLSNTGLADLIISSLKVEGYVIFGKPTPTDFSLTGNTCTSLHPGESCDINILFQAGITNYQSSFLKITSNDPVKPYKQVTIYGEIAYPQISYRGGDMGFCAQGQSVTKTVTILNIGHLDLNITGASLSGTDAGQFILSNTCTVIAPGDSCKMQVTMTPTKTGDLLANLVVVSNSRYNNLLNISLKGSSIIKTLELSTTGMNFGDVHVSEQSELMLELRNKGSGDLNITGINISGSGQCEFSFNNICTSIASGATCIVKVTFRPVFEGDKIASLIISSNDSNNPLQTVTLTGHASELLPLTVTISGEPEAGSEPLPVSFTAVVTGGQPPYSYLWDFDDLKRSQEVSPAHTFTGPGIYVVSLKLTDINNQTVTSTMEVAVSEAGIPTVLAKGEPVNGEIPLPVQFDAIVTGGNLPLTFLWEFGDGSTSTVPTSLHIYQTPGIYSARITVTDADGDMSRDSIMITAIWNNSISGCIWDETGTIPINNAKVVLIPVNDINHTTLQELDGSNNYLFPGLPEKKYTVLAIPDTLIYTGDLPTYLGDNIMLFNAVWIQVTGHVTGKDIKLIKKPAATSGQGSIAGTIVTGSKKGLYISEKTRDVKGDPLPGIYVFLRGTIDSKIKAYDISDNNGIFNFKGLENGTYHFLADYGGKPMDAVNKAIEISDAQKAIEILATVGPDKISVRNLTTGIKDETAENIEVYPVPASESIFIVPPDKLMKNHEVRISVLALSGRKVIIDRMYDIKNNIVTMSVEALPSGVYLIELNDGLNCYRKRIIVAR